MSDSDRLLTIYRTNLPLQADAVSSFLISHGVPAMARWTAMPGGIQEFYAEDQTRAEVCVYKNEWLRAMAILSEHRDEVTEILKTALPEPSHDMFKLRHLESAGSGIAGGLSALLMLLLAPVYWLGEFVAWLKAEIRRLTSSSRAEAG